MPLYVTDGKLQLGEPGQLAAQRSCCCGEEGEDPKDCMCPDRCMFQAEIIDPLPLGPSPAVPCSLITSDSIAEIIDDSMLCGNCFDEAAGYTRSKIDFYYYGSSYNEPDTLVRCVFSGKYAGGPRNGLEVYGWIEAAISMKCDVLEAPASLVISMSFQLSLYNGIQLQRLSSVKLGECRTISNANCGDFPPIRSVYLDSPVDVTLSLDSANGSPWQYAMDGVPELLEEPCIQQILENFSATFRITQRHSCRIVDCNCSTNLNGLKATFDGVDLTLGTYYDETTAEDGYDKRILHYENLGVYYFFRYKILPGGFYGDELSAEVFCDTDEEADPPVARWYVRFFSTCRVFDEFGDFTAETKRTEIGFFSCGESAGCNGRAEGESIPLGAPVDVEEIAGSPETTNGLDACAPPARAELAISEDCG